MIKTKNPFLRCNKWFQCLANLLFDPDKYFVFTPWCQRIGHLSIEIITAVCIAIRDKKQLILIPFIKSVNKEIINCEYNCKIYIKKDWKIFLLKSVLFFSGIFHYLYNGVRSKVVIILPFLSKIIPSIFFYPRYGIEKGNGRKLRLIGTKQYFDWNLLSSVKYDIQLTSDQLTCGKINSEKMGIPQNAWFVCLHIREQGYLGNSADNYRDSNISNYTKAIHFITKKGGYVIRMGDPSMTPIRPMENVIDYANSEYRSDLMDIYLVSQCRFFLGCDSGLFFLAWLFHKPCCLVNLAELVVSPPIFDHSIFIPKRFYSKKKRRFVSLKEELSTSTPFMNPDYMYVENSPEEIFETVKEHFCFLDNGKFTGNKRSQEEFHDLRRKRYENILSEKGRGYKHICQLEGTLPIKSRVGSYFLERCLDNSPYLQNLSKLYNWEE
tara:strand:- start:5823 stop:7133 length:1311 start_codon:yes stop_codon:yes gene_type:complete